MGSARFDGISPEPIFPIGSGDFLFIREKAGLPKAFPDSQLNKWRAPWHPGEDFHIDGCEVNQEDIIWYIDGAEVARKPNHYWHRPKHVALSLGLRKPFVKFHNNRNNAIDPESYPEAKSRLSQFPVSMHVDYVRVWKKEE